MAEAIDIESLSNTELAQLLVRVVLKLLGPDVGGRGRLPQPPIADGAQLLTAKQVATLWNVPETWVREQARMGKAALGSARPLCALPAGRYRAGLTQRVDRGVRLNYTIGIDP